MQGTIVRVNEARGFAFIERLGETRSDVFLHYTQLHGADFDDQLMGRRVEFRLEDTDRGPRAVDARLVE